MEADDADECSESDRACDGVNDSGLIGRNESVGSSCGLFVADGGMRGASC